MSRVRLIVSGVLVAFAAVATAASMASAAPHFTLCGNIGNGASLYNFPCATDLPAKNGNWELQRVKEGTKLSALSEGGPYHFSTNISTVAVKWACSAEKGSGWVEDPTGGGAGVSLMVSNFSSCTVEKPSGCKVAEPIAARSKTELKELGGQIWDVFKPDESTNFFTIVLSECGLATGTHNITGATAGLFLAAADTLMFEEEMDELAFESEKVKLEGSFTRLTSGGEPIQAMNP